MHAGMCVCACSHLSAFVCVCVCVRERDIPSLKYELWLRREIHRGEDWKICVNACVKERGQHEHSFIKIQHEQFCYVCFNILWAAGKQYEFLMRMFEICITVCLNHSNALCISTVNTSSSTLVISGSGYWVIYNVQDSPNILRGSRKNQHIAQICTTALFHMLAPTCFGSSLLSSGSFWIRVSYMKNTDRYGGLSKIYNIKLQDVQELTLVRPGVLCHSICFSTQAASHTDSYLLYIVDKPPYRSVFFT
jgi:hypothetical protein